ncbi:MAG: phosphatidate cytidylyltransferase, partial [Prevotella sp.]|nr:phosphatidate cytidylyltransferase [Prevotella sp.]
MKNFIIRTITGVLFVTAVVVSFLDPIAMVFLFALVTGLTIREFCGLVNERPTVQINQFISTVAGIYLFLAMAGHCSGWVTSDTVFIPYLITIIYLLVAELYLQGKDPINNWAYTMLAQLYIALPFSTINVLAFPQTGQYSFVLPLSIFVFLWMNDTGAYCVGSLLGRHKLFPRVSPGKSWEGSIGGGVLVVGIAVLIWYLLKQYDPEASNLSVWHWAGLGLTVVVFGTWG